MLLLRDLATSRMFTRVLSEWWRPLHLVFAEYYFFIASKIDADRRVMGIALAIKPLQGWSGFFVCTERFIPLVPCGSSPLRLFQVSCASAPLTLASLVHELFSAT